MHIKIKMLRLVNGRTQAAVAEGLNCSVSAYSKIEAGTTAITDTRLRQLAKFYHIDVADIYNYQAPQNKLSLPKKVKPDERKIERSEVILHLQGLLIQMFSRKFSR